MINKGIHLKRKLQVSVIHTMNSHINIPYRTETFSCFLSTQFLRGEESADGSLLHKAHVGESQQSRI
ncbi:hypothetical protein Mapa_005123 [Marchantia paleacea]|nr:hypothetical protein Mapa_005123 [Marchantia paleacea]